ELRGLGRRGGDGRRCPRRGERSARGVRRQPRQQRREIGERVDSLLAPATGWLTLEVLAILTDGAAQRFDGAGDGELLVVDLAQVEQERRQRIEAVGGLERGLRDLEATGLERLLSGEEEHTRVLVAVGAIRNQDARVLFLAGQQ